MDERSPSRLRGVAEDRAQQSLKPDSGNWEEHVHRGANAVRLQMGAI